MTTLVEEQQQHKVATGSWLKEQREAIRRRALAQLTFQPVPITGEPASVIVMRERRGDFDDPLSGH